jgi:DNA-binding CsgD family transcriptional regulator
VAQEKDLSEREREILRLVATGASNKEIARSLAITTSTVKVHLRNIFAKINVVSRTEATVYAIRRGLVQVTEARGGLEKSAAEALSGEAETVPPEAVGEVLAPAPEAHQTRGILSRRLALAVIGLVILAALAGAAVLGGPGVPGASPSPTPITATLAPGPTSTPVSRWQSRAPMPTTRSGLAAAVYAGRVYAIAGETTEAPTGVVERYDPVSNSWTALLSKPLPVADISAAMVGGRIFVPAGRLASGAVTSTLEVYDPSTDTWQQRSPLPLALSAYALVPFEGRLYLFGGWDGDRYLDSVFEYDPRTDSWSQKAAMTSARGYAAAVAAAGRIYLVGGYDGTRALALCEEYVPERDNGRDSPWRGRTPLPEGRYSMGIASVADTIHIIGGRGAEDGEALAPLRYLAALDAWEPFEPPLSEPWSSLAMAVVETKLYALGGRLEGTPTVENRSYQAIFTVAVPAIQ